MADSKKQSRTKGRHASIKYRFSAVGGASPELADFGCKEYAPPISNKHKQNSEIAEPKSVEILSTAELISAVGQIWDHMDPLSLLKTNRVSSSYNKGLPREDILGNLGLEVNGRAPTSADSNSFHVDSKAGDHFSHKVQPSLQSHKVSQKMSVFELCRESYIHSTLQSFTYLPDNYWKGRGVTSLGLSYELDNIYGWMSNVIPTRIKFLDKTRKVENKRNGEELIPGDTTSPVEGCLSVDKTHSVKNLGIRSDEFLIPGDRKHSAKNLAAEKAYCHPDLFKAKDSSTFDSSKLSMNTESTTSLCSDYFLGATENHKGFASVLSTPKSGLYADYQVNLLVSDKSAFEDCQHDKNDVELLENGRKQYGKFVIEEEPSTKICSVAHEKPQYTLAKQEHAFAGALAGICVSLCLHPVDTVKTVIQSCRAEQKSICYIGRSIVSERGLTGLYRGLSSNIASSAPISAIYTFTYESVKGALLPLFPKEYYSLAHCMAGGCASIATSFIFTPSERIKQQMQVGSHYQNCWSALVGIIGKGGLPSLYAGWGAVLCRNVPQSIIKFYMYESLKQVMLASQHSAVQPSALQTLLCGGLAGSSAALCTTPFDVVKTRLQTQIPGSRSQYNNVFHALQEISKQEGLKGLYRGLVPRLVMYMSQGALFFSSYEFFKSLFSVGVQVQQSNDQTIQGQQTMVSTAASSQSSSDPSPSSSRKLHS